MNPISVKNLTKTFPTPGGSLEILAGINAEVESGGNLAVVGPSGSGKTTLLNTLAGQLPYSPALSLEGHIAANGSPIPSYEYKTGFVAQEDLFFSQLTVRETLNMAAELRAKASTTSEGRAVLVESVIRRLGLSKCADTVIGDAKTRGLSGGEKKRLSIACEMIGRPQMIMADEPTSGLDAFGAQQVVRVLKDLASDGNTVILSIHQPRSSIFEMIDDICLLSEGRVIYCGTREGVLPYFEELGHKCPSHFNPAEFLADLVAVDHTSEETERESMARIDKLAATYRASNPASATPRADALQDGARQSKAKEATAALVSSTLFLLENNPCKASDIHVRVPMNTPMNTPMKTPPRLTTASQPFLEDRPPTTRPRVDDDLCENFYFKRGRGTSGATEHVVRTSTLKGLLPLGVQSTSGHASTAIAHASATSTPTTRSAPLVEYS